MPASRVVAAVHHLREQKEAEVNDREQRSTSLLLMLLFLFFLPLLLVDAGGSILTSYGNGDGCLLLRDFPRFAVSLSTTL